MLQDVLNDSMVETVKTVAPLIVERQSMLLPFWEKILSEVFLPICIVAMIFGSAFVILRLFILSWSKQRMLMIEKGLVEVVKTDKEPKTRVRNAFIVFGFSFGLVIGLLIYSVMRRLPDGFYMALAFGFAAAGYLAYYYYFVFKQENKPD